MNAPARRRRGDLLVGLIVGSLLVALLASVPVLYALGAFDAPDGLPELPPERLAEDPGPSEPEPAGLPLLNLFRDVTAEAGINFTCRNGEEADLRTLLESLGGGVALIDYDGDGLLDVFLIGGGE